MTRRILFIIAAAWVLAFIWQTYAHAMPHDLSNTWCAGHIPESAMIDRVHYYAWIEKCHRRHKTKPCWGLPGYEPDEEYCAQPPGKRIGKPVDCDDDHGSCDNPYGWVYQCRKGGWWEGSDKSACKALKDFYGATDDYVPMPRPFPGFEKHYPPGCYLEYYGKGNRRFRCYDKLGKGRWASPKEDKELRQ